MFRLLLSHHQGVIDCLEKYVVYNFHFLRPLSPSSQVGMWIFFKCFGLFTWFVLQFVIVNYIIVFTFVW